MILTRLELYLQSKDLVLAEVARLAGYSPLHFRRLRMEEATATRGGILAVTGAVRKLTHERVKPGVLFERADAFLKGSGRSLSEAHVADRQALDAVLSEPVTSRFSDRIQSTGVSSEAAIRHLLRAARARLDTEPAAAASIYEAAANVGRMLPDTPRQLVASLQGHAYRGRAEALKMVGSFDEALAYLAMAGERFIDAGLCTDEAGRVDYTRAAILFEMELWDDALPIARSARRRAVRSGNARLAANADLMEAAIQFEQGDSEAAHARWLRLTKVLHRLNNREDLGRVWINLGMCDIHRNRPADARRWLNLASAAFKALNNAAELARTRWNMATYVTAFGSSPPRALRLFRNAYRAFQRLQMWLDAGCVGLDMIELMIETERPDTELTRHACDVADTFAQAAFGGSLAPALSQLRNIASQKDRRRIVRTVRTALRDAKAHCSELAVAALQSRGLGKAG